MVLNRVRDEFNIHYFDYFVPFKRDVDPKKLKKLLQFLTSAFRCLGAEKKAKRARLNFANHLSKQDFSAIKATKTSRDLKKLLLEVYE